MVKRDLYLSKGFFFIEISRNHHDKRIDLVVTLLQDKLKQTLDNNMLVFGQA